MCLIKGHVGGMMCIINIGVLCVKLRDTLEVWCV